MPLKNVTISNAKINNIFLEILAILESLFKIVHHFMGDMTKNKSITYVLHRANFPFLIM